MEEFRNYLQLKNYQKSTIKQYVERTKPFLDYQEKTGKSVADYCLELQNRNLKNSSLNSYLLALKSYAIFLKDTQKPTFTVTILRKKVVFETVDYLTTEEIKILFEATQKRPDYHHRDQAVLGCLYHLALRASEAVNLKITDIDFENKLVFIQKSKTGHQRQVPMNESIVSIFKSYLSHRKDSKTISDFLLIGQRGKLKTVCSVETILKVIAKQSGLQKRIYPHLLRHSIATHLLQNGMPLEKVSQFLGHKSIGSTQRYTHF
ncbi:MAG: site-specific integrase [Flavobacterium sp.]